MALSFATVGAKITAALYNAVVNFVNPMGQSLVVPTSVSTGTISSLGNVTFSAASTVTINGCFTSAYNRYTIQFQVDSSSATNTITVGLSAAGTVTTAANYDLQVLQGVSATASAAVALAGTSWTVSAVTGTIHDVVMEINSPALAAATYGQFRSHSTQNPATAPAVNMRGVSHRLATAYDGISFVATGGTITGSVRVYGWNKG